MNKCDKFVKVSVKTLQLIGFSVACFWSLFGTPILAMLYGDLGKHLGEAGSILAVSYPLFLFCFALFLGTITDDTYYTLSDRLATAVLISICVWVIGFFLFLIGLGFHSTYLYLL